MTVITVTQYITSKSTRAYGGRITIAVYDPNRWDGQGGARFGFEAEVHVSEGLRDRVMVAEVSMGAIGSHSPADADLRVDVYRQAADLARFINDELLAGEDWERISMWLSEHLIVDQPVTTRFKYAGAGDELQRRADELAAADRAEDVNRNAR